MKTVGIICEYNPFHLGHLRQMRSVREILGEDTAIICVMSGNYVQRGMPAMWDKYTRANAAVACGADLVLELPVTKVLQSAEGFAFGGVEILDKLGCVDYLCFGAECGDSDKLLKLAKQLDSPQCRESLQVHLEQGASYAAARQMAANDQEYLLSSPNNILGVEYCRAILRLNSKILPLAIERNGDYHAEQADPEAPSATAVRALFPHGDWASYVPQQVKPYLEQAVRYDLSFGMRAVLARLRALDDAQWQRCAHGSEGLWSKAMKAARSACTLEEMIDLIKSKRYPRTRIQRLLLCAYLGLDQNALTLPTSYVRLLAASRTGRQMLRHLKKISQLPLINPGEPPKDTAYYRLEAQAADLYTLFSSADHMPCSTEQNARLQIN